MKSTNLLLCFFIAILCCGCALTLHEASSDGNTDRVRLLIGKGADINAADEKGLTPLMTAAGRNHPETAALLLRAGADLHKKDKNGKTAIDHAFEQESPETFILLLEEGAEIHFDEKERPAEDGDVKKFFYDLADEYRLYREIISEKKKPAPKDFDAFFSRFSNGYYSADVKKRFEALLQKDFNERGNPPEAAKIQAFMDKYSDMGKHYYIVTADSLNIRNSASPAGQWMGNYRRGDRVYALEENGEWIRTEKGWISSEYIKSIRKTIPLLRTYLEKAEKEMRNLSSPPKKTKALTKDSIRKKRPKKAKKSVSLPKNRKKIIQADSLPTARRELERILDDPDMEKLENFIRKYKNKEAYRPLLETAREKYKELLLNL